VGRQAGKTIFFIFKIKEKFKMPIKHKVLDKCAVKFFSGYPH
jgi:hypothetical protein